MTTTGTTAIGDSFTGAMLDGRYRIDGLIGRGGMATVYRGTDTALGRAVAVKVFAEAAEGIDDASRRRSEVALLASVEHRALVRLYDSARDDASGREYLVMEFVDGQDLRETLRSAPVGAADAAGLAADIGEALHVIHSRGIVHRDVKPANVLLERSHLPSRSWNAKLADFGIARLIDDARLTRTGLLVGTPGYLSPEQVTGDATGSAADVYAFGLVLLEARTGVTAFPGRAAESANARLVRDPEIPPSLGSDWVDLLRAMTTRDASERPTALEVAVAAGRLDTSSTGSHAAATTAAVASAESEAATRVLATQPASTSATGAGPSPATGPTRVLPATPQASVRATTQSPAVDRPVASSLRRRGRRVAIVVSVLAAIAAIVAGVLLLPGLIDTLTPEPVTTFEPLPTLPAELGELGGHLQQLDEAVTR